ncbi:MAG: FAD-dependent oxidoreductase [Acidobacteriota bacterium]|nr:FAD-dependent oxidoreductase [Acidobacteriota bacterium]
MSQPFSIITFSHLRWDFVFQRPQHLLSRLAKNRRVIFIEEPIFDPSSEPHWEFQHAEPNVLICRPHTPIESRGFTDEQMAVLKLLLAQLLIEERISDYVVWFYTPLALPLAQNLRPKAVIYDCMDELSAFLNAPRELLDRETKLLKLADVVFTGGPSLYRAKKNRHSNAHCFSSSVDARHFAKAKPGAGPEAAEQAALPKPRVGYFGVIDERIDLQLLDWLARTQPDWQIVMVGPVVKIDPAALPKHPNIHYFGQKDYKELPSYVAGWDVCILPFARNESTKFISPTKTLEYMAAERPIVSTPIADVAEPYGKIVYLGDTSEQFTAACERAMSASTMEKSARLGSMRDVLSKTSWDATAKSMEELIVKAIRKNLNLEDGMFVPASAQVSKESVSAPPTVVIGAGPTGLSAAYHLGENAVLLEQNSRVGGWCRSIEDKGFTFDHAGHIMFSNDAYVHQLYKMLVGENIHWQNREAWIYSKNVYTRYPFQGALYGLPPDVIKECIMGAVESRFGGQKKIAAAPASNGHAKTNGHAKAATDASACKAESITDCCADGILESSAKLVHSETSEPYTGEPRNFEEFIYKVWGAGIAKHFAIPYNKKLWAVPLSEMETSWLGGRVPLPDLEEMIEGALKPVGKPMGPNARFGYPLRGGFQSLMDGFLPNLKGQLRLNTTVAEISPSKHAITLKDGTTMSYQNLISTMPLPILIQSMGAEAPYAVREAAAKLRHVSVRCVNIGVGRENLTDKHWIYYPEDSVFHRIFVQGNASPHCNAPGGFGLTCEITYSEYKPLPCDGEELIQKCIQDCIKVGIFNADDKILTANQVDMPYAYVVYDHGRAQSVTMIREWLASQDIVLAGRYSEWEYYNSDHAFLAGKKAADKVIELQKIRGLAKRVPQPWQVVQSSV